MWFSYYLHRTAQRRTARNCRRIPQEEIAAVAFPPRCRGAVVDGAAYSLAHGPGVAHGWRQRCARQRCGIGMRAEPSGHAHGGGLGRRRHSVAGREEQCRQPSASARHVFTQQTLQKAVHTMHFTGLIIQKTGNFRRPPTCNVQCCYDGVFNAARSHPRLAFNRAEGSPTVPQARLPTVPQARLPTTRPLRSHM